MQSAREAARRTACANNTKQIALATLNFQSAFGYFPPSRTLGFQDANGNPLLTATGAAKAGSGGAWGTLARILPFMEEGAIYKAIDFSHSNGSMTLPGSTTLLQEVRIGAYMCPSEQNDILSTGNASYPANYAFNEGTWLMYDPSTNTGGNGAFYCNAQLTPGSFTDGLSKTLMTAEVKAYTSDVVSTTYTDSNLPAMPVTPVPYVDGTSVTGAQQVAGLITAGGGGSLTKLGTTLQANEGHVEWGSGRSLSIAFTTTFTPNTVVPFTDPSGNNYDIDWSNVNEGSLTEPTFGCLTSRSYHGTGVNASYMDGSVHFVANLVDWSTWQAVSTRAGGEIILNQNLLPAQGETQGD